MSNFKSDEQIAEELNASYAIYENMVEMIANNKSRGLIITGPAGVGKSHTTVSVMTNHCRKNQNFMYRHVKGYATPVALYKTLYAFRNSSQIMVLDDSDDALNDETSLNILKGALDSSPVRTIDYLAESPALRKEGIPNTFEYKGSIIFISNLDFEKSSKKLQPHMNAMMSRCHYMNLGFKTIRYNYVRIKQLAPVILAPYNIDVETRAELLQFIDENLDNFIDVSLRLLLKLVELYQNDKRSWRKYAAATSFKKECM